MIPKKPAPDASGDAIRGGNRFSDTVMPDDESGPPRALTGDRQRIDKWLWHARVVRTRPDAAGLATSGRVRINGQRIDGAGRPVRPGDVITIALDGRVRVLKVAGFLERRGSADAARRLYEDLDAMSAPAGSPAPAPR